jgi:hypothetical protein
VFDSVEGVELPSVKLSTGQVTPRGEGYAQAMKAE